MASVKISEIDVSGYILPPTIRKKYRSESIEYALDGSVLKDRIGSPKLSLSLQFGLMPINIWNSLQAVLMAKQFQVVFSDMIGWTKNFHCAGDLPTPYIVSGENQNAIVGNFTIEIEEV